MIDTCKKYVPNVLTGLRGVGAIALLFLQVFSFSFVIIYTLAGFTDMMDGYFARKWKVESKFGERFDSICDLIFVIVCMYKMIPAVTIELWVYIWAGIIILIKLSNIIISLICHHKVVFPHTVANKFTGLLLFLVPYAYMLKETDYIIIIVCLVATIAAIQEGKVIRTGTFS